MGLSRTVSEMNGRKSQIFPLPIFNASAECVPLGVL